MRLLFATTNPEKLSEARAILSDGQLQVELLSLKDFPELAHLEVDEVGGTLKENAYLKARTYAERTGLSCFSEDFGIEVEALHGEPGVKSKRWVKGSDHDRNQTLLKKMTGEENRQAVYHCEICLFDPASNDAQYFSGRLPGVVAKEERGNLSFGYDPVFIPKGYQETLGELGRKVKNKISHRRQALEKLRQFLQQQG